MTKYLDPIMFADDTNLFYFINEWILANKVSLKAKKKKKKKKKKNKQTNEVCPIATANHDIQ